MILDKKLNVKIAKYNIEHYINFFDVKLGDIIEIDTELHLQSESNKKINVKCDLCEEQRYIKYQSYRKNKERNIKYPILVLCISFIISLPEFNRFLFGFFPRLLLESGQVSIGGVLLKSIVGMLLFSIISLFL